eukprot:15073151-Heterocapsa_arctica.AAC.1
MLKRGPGRMKHLDIKRLWLQEELRRGRLLIGHISSENNVADIFTKPLTAARLLALVAQLGLVQNDEGEKIC